MNSGDIAFYVCVGLAILFLLPRVLGSVGAKIYAGAFLSLFVVLGYLTLKYCINWDAVTGLLDLGKIGLIALAVIVGAVIVGKLFCSAGRDWLWMERMAHWRHLWRRSRRHWWWD